MKICITGGAGFIGSHITDAYLDLGHEVVVLDNLETGRERNLNPRATFVKGSVTDADLVERLFAEHTFEIVNHHAARGNPRLSVEDPIGFFEVNVAGGLRVLDAARRHGVRKVIYSSSGGCVYGELAFVPATEDHPLLPVDPYGASKECFETYVRAYGIQYGLDYTILRYANIYGPRQNPNGEAGVISIFAGRMLKSRPVTINGDGGQLRDYVYVSDCVRANVLSLSRAERATVNIGTGVGTSVNQVFTALSDIVGYDVPAVHWPAKGGEVPRNELDARRAAELLGWKPEVELQEGLRRTVDYIRATEDGG